MSIFEELDRCSAQIKEEKKPYHLCLYDGLFTNGHVSKMKNATLTYLALGRKCTCERILNGKSWYLVYGGRYSKKIISEVAKMTGKSKRTVKRDLKCLKESDLAEYESQDGVGFRIAVKPIPRGFERRFKDSRNLGQNVIAPMTKCPST